MTLLSQTASIMAGYFFSIRNGKPFNDIDGLELADLRAVRAEAIGLARDLMRLDYGRRDWSGWAIRVTDDAHHLVLDLPFAEVV